ncbi:MAG: Asp23/Gls24 family envelope stress response protein [Christensenellales bacterium]
MGEAEIQINNEKQGKITFASDVVATIAGLAAIEVAGIAGMSGGVVDGVIELLGRRNLTKGVKVEVGSEECAVDVYVVVNYGVAIHTVAYNVQENIKRAIETMTGLRVVEVNVYIQGVSIEKEPKAQDIARVR